MLKELIKVHKHRPKVIRVLFGNGTFLIDDLEGLDSWRLINIVQKVSGHEGQYKWVGPKYLHALWTLCELSVERNVTLNDVYVPGVEKDDRT